MFSFKKLLTFLYVSYVSCTLSMTNITYLNNVHACEGLMEVKLINGFFF